MKDWTTYEGKLYLDGKWLPGAGNAHENRSPVNNQLCWQGRWADRQQASDAVSAARRAFPAWSTADLTTRRDLCRAFASYVERNRDELAQLISTQTGKPYWESQSEVATVIGKVTNSIEAQLQRRWLVRDQQTEMAAVTRFKPHGVMLVLGPFNLPAHLPGAHIVPALLAGNTIVFKPSEVTAAVGQWLVTAWEAAGLPHGVLNLVHGAAEIAQQMAADHRVDGILFTGSYRAGAALHKLCAGQPEKLLALEMGGNNPLVVHRIADLQSAVMQILESAYITSGQRCTCARRLILTDAARPDELIALLLRGLQHVRVGLPFDEPAPFMGTLIHAAAADRMLQAQEQLLHQGAKGLKLMERNSSCEALLTPGLLDVNGMELEDEEHFGPLLCVERARDLDEAIARANRTRFGLSAGLLSDDYDDFNHFVERVRAGIVNWNRQTTGASGKLPFGGIGASGNHAPSGYYAADYCAYPVASIECSKLPDVNGKCSPGLEGVASLWSSK